MSDAVKKLNQSPESYGPKRPEIVNMVQEQTQNKMMGTSALQKLLNL